MTDLGGELRYLESGVYYHLEPQMEESVWNAIPRDASSQTPWSLTQFTREGLTGPIGWLDESLIPMSEGILRIPHTYLTMCSNLIPSIP